MALYLQNWIHTSLAKLVFWTNSSNLLCTKLAIKLKRINFHRRNRFGSKMDDPKNFTLDLQIRFTILFD